MQFAFRKGSSTETAISRTIHKIEQAFAKGEQVIGVFLDIKGAFDNVSVEAVQAALTRKNFPPWFTNWYINYMTGRCVSTELGGEKRTIYLKDGTPRGGYYHH